MRIKELLHLVFLNLTQNKFKVILTSIGIIVGAATIVIVIAVGKGGQMDVAEQFKNLNAGAIDISYEMDDTQSSSSGTSGGGNMPNFDGMSMGGGGPQANAGGGNQDNNQSGKSSNGQGSDMQMPSGGDSMGGGSMGGNSMGSMFENFMNQNSGDRQNQEKITLDTDDMDDLQTFVPGLDDATISYTTKQDIYGGEIEDAESYSIAGVLNNYSDLSNLTMSIGDFITSTNEENKEKVCVLGYDAAKAIFGSVEDAYDSIVYIDDRPYTVNGVLTQVGTVASRISPDKAIFIPYSTGIKYLTGSDISPSITVIADDVNQIDTVVSDVKTVLASTYPNAEFTISDAGSKMEAASESNNILTIMLFVMATIVFIIGGIGIMNVLFVSVKERTEEIGILKAIGGSKKDILLEFIFEACCISILGGILGVLLSFGITPLIRMFDVRVELSASGAGLAIAFSFLTGTIFGFYPAWKASRLIPVDALSSN